MDGEHFAIKLLNSDERYRSARQTFSLVCAGFGEKTVPSTLSVFHNPEKEKSIQDSITDIDLSKVGDKVLVMKSMKDINPHPCMRYICSKTPDRIY